LVDLQIGIIPAWHHIMYAALIILRTHYSEFTEWLCELSKFCWHVMVEPRELGAIAVRSEES
jgi:hypothetical protein